MWLIFVKSVSWGSAVQWPTFRFEVERGILVIRIVNGLCRLLKVFDHKGFSVLAIGNWNFSQVTNKSREVPLKC